MERIAQPPFIAIARIVRTRGNRGEVLADLHHAAGVGADNDLGLCVSDVAELLSQKLIGKLDLILVTHGGVVKALLCHVLGLDVRYLFRLKQDNTAVSLVEVDDATRRVVLVNGPQKPGLTLPSSGELASIIAAAGSREIKPYVGLYPTTPQYAAGRMTDPLVWVPTAAGMNPAATAAADPLEDPPGVCARFHGLRVFPGA